MKAAKTFSQLRTECGVSCLQDNRGGSTERGYGARWQRMRGRFLAENPLCTECQREGRTTAATTVDHVKPHKGNPDLFWNKDNLQSSCTHHHNRKTAKEDGGFGNEPR